MFLSTLVSCSHSNISDAPLQARKGRRVGGLIMPERRDCGFGSPKESDGPCS
jgi:hypothetical protein